ncbi:MAG: hypothetical protein H7122_19380 [Chitinophagaceae bacterium]|nr:hypothetical protein [Chitinophagaceae bacterium]
MNFEEFKTSLSLQRPPENISAYLKALWFAGKDDWESSHHTAQDIHDKSGSWIHAYLHREEGDTFNANYWYNKAARRMPGYSVQQEWEEIVKELLDTGC